MLFRNQGGVRYQVPISTQHQSNAVNFANRTSNSDGYPRLNAQSVTPNLIYSQSPAQVKYVHTDYGKDYGKQSSHVQNVQTKTDKGQGSPKQTDQIKKGGLSNGKKILIGVLALLLIAGGVVGTILYLNQHKSSSQVKVQSANSFLEDGSSQPILEKAENNVRKDISQILAKAEQSSIKAVSPTTSVSLTSESGQNLKSVENIVSQQAKALTGQINKQLLTVQSLNPLNSEKSQVITYTKTPTTSVQQTPITTTVSNPVTTPSEKTQINTSQLLIEPTIVDPIAVPSVKTAKTHVSLN